MDETRRTFDLKVDAVLWTGDNPEEVMEFFHMDSKPVTSRLLPASATFDESISAPNFILIPLMDGKYQWVAEHHWILRYPYHIEAVDADVMELGLPVFDDEPGENLLDKIDWTKGEAIHPEGQA